MKESNSWPELDYESWRPTSETLHMWTQIVGKIRMVQTPWINHSWHVPLYVSARGLSTHFVPCPGGGFEIEVDFSRHQLRVVRSDGRSATRPLQAEPVAAFYRRLMSTLSDLGLNIAIHTVPNEISDAIPFDRDEVHRSPYENVRRSGDPEATLLGFLQSTYEAGANLAAWDRFRLERPAGWDPWPPGFRNF